MNDPQSNGANGAVIDPTESSVNIPTTHQNFSDQYPAKQERSRMDIKEPIVSIGSVVGAATAIVVAMSFIVHLLIGFHLDPVVKQITIDMRELESRLSTKIESKFQRLEDKVDANQRELIRALSVQRTQLGTDTVQRSQ